MATKKKTEIEIGEVTDSDGGTYTGETNSGETNSGESRGISMEAVREEVANILAEAKAEAAKIIEEAKQATGKKKRGEMTPEQKAEANELVEIRLFRDNNKYKDDVFVAVNGENVVIKRGETVKIKRKFAKVLEASDKQDYEAAVMMEQKQKEFRNETLKNNI